MIVIDRRNFFTNLKYSIKLFFSDYYCEAGEVCYIETNGDISFRKDGMPHRDGDLPAIIHTNGYTAYYKNGKRHREDNKPAVIYSNGDEQYYYNDKFHRTNSKCYGYVGYKGYFYHR